VNLSLAINAQPVVGTPDIEHVSTIDDEENLPHSRLQRADGALSLHKVRHFAFNGRPRNDSLFSSNVRMNRVTKRCNVWS
jgi:hypothetical protein